MHLPGAEGGQGEVIEAYKIIMQKYDQDCTTGIFKMMEDEIRRGNT